MKTMAKYAKTAFWTNNKQKKICQKNCLIIQNNFYKDQNVRGIDVRLTLAGFTHAHSFLVMLAGSCSIKLIRQDSLQKRKCQLSVNKKLESLS